LTKPEKEEEQLLDITKNIPKLPLMKGATSDTYDVDGDNIPEVLQGLSEEVLQFTQLDPNENASDEKKESNEQMLMRVAYHIKHARAQQKLYILYTADAIKSKLQTHLILIWCTRLWLIMARIWTCWHSTVPSQENPTNTHH